MMLFKPVNIALFNRDNRHNFGMIIVTYCLKSPQEGVRGKLTTCIHIDTVQLK